MTETTGIVRRDHADELISAQEVGLVRDLLAGDGVTDQEFRLFLATCSHLGLNPLYGQISATKRGGKLVVQIGIAGYRAIAERTGRWVGPGPVEWCGPDGKWRDVWLEDKPPAAARATVFRLGPDGRGHAVSAVVTWREFVQKTREGEVTSMWKTKPAYMLGKCARAAAFREAFPAEFSPAHPSASQVELFVDDGDEELERSPWSNQGRLDDQASAIVSGSPHPAGEGGSGSGAVAEDLEDAGATRPQASAARATASSSIPEPKGSDPSLGSRGERPKGGRTTGSSPGQPGSGVPHTFRGDDPNGYCSECGAYMEHPTHKGQGRRA